MTSLKFKDLEFIDEAKKVKVLFLKHFYFYIDKPDLEKIGKFKINKNELDFDAGEKRTHKFYDLLEKGLSVLKNKVTGKSTVYLHKGCDIPLIGNGSFGIIDRGSNLIEIKPVCGCNLSCIYCSVDEDKRTVDFLIEKDYLVEELKKTVLIKENDVEVHIGCNGEPLLYEPLIELVRDIKLMSKVKRVSMDTNGTLLTKESVDKLIDAGLTRFNLSINAFDEELSKKIADGGYSINHVKMIAEYISKKSGSSLIIAPVWMKGINDDELDKIIVFSKSINAKVGIQNFLHYQFGKNPVKEVPMEEFYEKLKELEKKHSIKLVFDAKDFDIKPDKTLNKPFKKDDKTEGAIVCLGRLPGEKIAVSKERTISLYDCNKQIGQKVKIKITKAKHNIYSGVCLK